LPTFASPPDTASTSGTTNLLERTFEEERRRTKVIPRLLDEKSAMKLVFATLIRVSDRWQRVSVSDLERQQLRLLRRELGIDPDPITERKGVRSRKRSAASYSTSDRRAS
jgi:hypothetical protein